MDSKISFDTLTFAVDHNKGPHGISKIINASTKGQKFSDVANKLKSEFDKGNPLAISKFKDIAEYKNLGREGIYNCKKSLFKDNDTQKIEIWNKGDKYALRRGFHRCLALYFSGDAHVDANHENVELKLGM